MTARTTRAVVVPITAMCQLAVRQAWVCLGVDFNQSQKPVMAVGIETIRPAIRRKVAARYRSWLSSVRANNGSSRLVNVTAVPEGGSGWTSHEITSNVAAKM